MQTIAVLGTGMAGLGAAYALRDQPVRCICYDKNPYYGGHTATFVQPGGFVFDDGPHVSFTKNERLQSLFADNVCHEYETLPARLNNYWHGYWITHPAQCNLYGLPTLLDSSLGPCPGNLHDLSRLKQCVDQTRCLGNGGLTGLAEVDVNELARPLSHAAHASTRT